MRKSSLAAALAAGALAFAVAACGSDDTPSTSGGGGDATATATEAAKAKVGVILPDAASSARWETADRKYLGEAFTAAGVESDIQNANGDKAKFATIADQMLNSGANVLLIVNLDSPSAAAVIAKAKQQGVPVIDYDRLTLGGGASYYVSFDNVAVGTAQGEGLVKCMQANGDNSGDVALLNGSPTDNNATLFKQGYEKAITDAGYTSRPISRSRIGITRRPARSSSRCTRRPTVSSSASTPPTTASAAPWSSVLKRNGQNGKVPATGQDATDEGLQRVLSGDQCMTVYKAIKKEADAAAALAIALAKGDTAGADGQATGTVDDTETKAKVKSVLLTPQAIFPENVKDVVADGFTTADKLCTTAALKKACDGERRQRMTEAVEGQQRAPLLSLRGINKSFGAVL